MAERARYRADELFGRLSTEFCTSRLTPGRLQRFVRLAQHGVKIAVISGDQGCFVKLKTLRDTFESLLKGRGEGG